MNASRLLVTALLLLTLASTASAANTLHLRHDLQPRVPVGDLIVTVQVLDEQGQLTDLDQLSCEITDPFHVTQTVTFRRKSLGTYQATLQIKQVNIYYLRFLPQKPGFQFTGLEASVHGDKTIPLFDPLNYMLPIALLVSASGVYLVYQKWRHTKR